MNFDDIAIKAITELIGESVTEDTDLNDDDFADYAQMLMLNSDDATMKSLAFDETALEAIFNIMINYCDARNLDH